MSFWDISRGRERCHKCRCLMGAGEQIYRVTAGRWPTCTTCAQSHYGVEPPADCPVRTIADELNVAPPVVHDTIGTFRLPNAPQLLQMHAEHGPGPEGRVCASCTFCRRTRRNRSHRLFTICERFSVRHGGEWDPDWPACGRFMER